MIHVENKEIVVPGELVATGDFRPREGAEKDGENIYATVVGITYVNSKNKYVKVVPLERKYYIPQKNDTIVGVVEELAFRKAILDINSAYKGILDVRDTTSDRNAEIEDIFSVGDAVYAKVDDTSESVRLYAKPRRYGKLHGGRLITIPSAKVPRVIGRKGSMISVMKKYTNCRIQVGQNGRIWVKGEKADRVLEAIRIISAESHKSGLTEKITNFLKEER